MGYAERFINRILNLSEWSNWQDAKYEWRHIASDTIPGSNCLCGHDITEVCTIKNTINGNEAEVGRCCVKKFMNDTRVNLNIDTDFKILLGVARNSEYTISNIEQWRHLLNNWQYRFYLDLGRKRNLSDKQRFQKLKINMIIVDHIKNKGKVT